MEIFFSKFIADEFEIITIDVTRFFSPAGSHRSQLPINELKEIEC